MKNYLLMKERKLEERKKEEKSERSKVINNKRKEVPSENKPKDLPKNKERRRNNFANCLIDSITLSISITKIIFVLLK